MTTPQLDPATTDAIRSFIMTSITYCNGATRRARRVLQARFQDAEFEFGGEEYEAVMREEGRTVPVFINVYPSLEPRQVRDDLEDQRRATRNRRCLTLFVTPTNEADELATILRDDYPTLNAGVCIWKLDLDQNEQGWTWTSGEVATVFSL